MTTPFSTVLDEVRLGEFDLGGVLYHANYFHLYEVARERFLRAGGCAYSELVGEGAHLALTESHQRFLAPIRYGESPLLLLWTDQVRKASCTFHYRIEKNGQTVHEAWTRHAYIQQEHGVKDSPFNVRPFPDKLFEILERFQAP